MLKGCLGHSVSYGCWVEDLGREARIEIPSQAVVVSYSAVIRSKMNNLVLKGTIGNATSSSSANRNAANGLTCRKSEFWSATARREVEQTVSPETRGRIEYRRSKPVLIVESPIPITGRTCFSLCSSSTTLRDTYGWPPV